MTGPRIVDRRYSECILAELEYEYGPGVFLSVSEMARGLGVTNGSVWMWKTQRSEIQWKTVKKFINCPDWRGRIARTVYELEREKRFIPARRLPRYGTWQGGRLLSVIKF